MHYYTFNIGDYRRDTAHLTILEHGAYRMLLDSYYLNEIPLDADDAKLMRTHCARSADEVQAIKTILNEFFLLTDAGWIHTRCDEDIAKYHAKSTKAKQSAKARWSKEAVKNQKVTSKECENDANAMRTHSESNANHKPITNNQEPITNNQLLDKTSVLSDDEKPLYLLATKKQDEPFIVTQDIFDFYKQQYGKVDIDNEFKKMSAWLFSNDKKRKTKRGMKAFINSWLSRASEKPSNVVGFKQSEQDYTKRGGF